MISQAPIPKYSIFQRLKLFKPGLSKWDKLIDTTSDESFKFCNLSKPLKATSIGVENVSYIAWAEGLIKIVEEDIKQQLKKFDQFLNIF